MGTTEFLPLLCLDPDVSLRPLALRCWTAALRPPSHKPKELDQPDAQQMACEHGRGSIVVNYLSSSKPCLLPPTREPQSQGAPALSHDLRQNPWPLPSPTTHGMRGCLDRPGGTPHLTDKKLCQAFLNAASSVNSWAAQRSRLSDLSWSSLSQGSTSAGLDNASGCAPCTHPS